MLGTVYQRLENDSSPDIQRADSFRRVQLMTDHRQQVDAKVIHRDGDLSNRLCGIRVNEHAALASGAISSDILHFQVRVLVILAVRGYSRSAILIEDTVLSIDSGDVPSQFCRRRFQTRQARRVSEVRPAVSTAWSRRRVD